MAALETLDMTDELLDQVPITEDPGGMGEDSVINMEWVDLEIEVALDSGCCDHVMDVENDSPGYVVVESASSRRGGASSWAAVRRSPMRVRPH